MWARHTVLSQSLWPTEENQQDSRARRHASSEARYSLTVHLVMECKQVLYLGSCWHGTYKHMCASTSVQCEVDLSTAAEHPMSYFTDSYLLRMWNMGGGSTVKNFLTPPHTQQFTLDLSVQCLVGLRGFCFLFFFLFFQISSSAWNTILHPPPTVLDPFIIRDSQQYVPSMS